MGGIVKKQAEAVVPAALRREAAARYLSISPAKFDKLRREDPSFPRPHILGAQTKVYSRKQIDEWLEQSPTEGDS